MNEHKTNECECVFVPEVTDEEVEEAFAYFVDENLDKSQLMNIIRQIKEEQKEEQAFSNNQDHLNHVKNNKNKEIKFLTFHTPVSCVQ